MPLQISGVSLTGEPDLKVFMFWGPWFHCPPASDRSQKCWAAQLCREVALRSSQACWKTWPIRASQTVLLPLLSAYSSVESCPSTGIPLLCFCCCFLTEKNKQTLFHPVDYKQKSFFFYSVTQRHALILKRGKRREAFPCFFSRRPKGDFELLVMKFSLESYGEMTAMNSPYCESSVIFASSSITATMLRALADGASSTFYTLLNLTLVTTLQGYYYYHLHSTHE